MKGFAADEDPLKLLEEREAIHLLLPQTTSEKINKNYAAFSINPSTRYPTLSGLVPLGEVASLYDAGTGPIKTVQRAVTSFAKSERRPAVLAEAASRKRSKDDLIVCDRSELSSKPTDAAASSSTIESHSPKSKSQIKSEGRSFFRSAQKPKPTITSADDLHVHKRIHRKKVSKEFPMDDHSVILLSHRKITDEDNISSAKTPEHEGKPAVTADRPILPSSSHSVNMVAPSVSGYSSSHSGDRSPTCNEVNVLKMKATFEKRDLEAKTSASVRQRVPRHGTADTSAAKMPRSASFSDLQDTQLLNAAAFPSSNPQPASSHRPRRPATEDCKVKLSEENPASVKDRKEPKKAEKSTFMKWLKEPHRQVAAMVSNLMHGSYSPKDQTDCGNVDNEASYTPLSKDSISTTPSSDETSVHSPEEATHVVCTDQEAVVDVAKDTSLEKQYVHVESTTLASQESLLSTEDPIVTPEDSTAKDGDFDVLNDSADPLDDVRVQLLVTKLQPAMVSLHLMM